MPDIFEQLNTEFGLSVSPPDKERVIWKYVMTSPDQTFNIPLGGQYLASAVAPEGLAMWFLVDPSAEKVVRRFITTITGKPIHGHVLTYIALCSSMHMTPTGPKFSITHVIEVQP